MPKKLEKVEELKIRLTTEEKNYIKEISKAKGITMSKFILDLAVPTAKKQLEALESKEIIESKIVATDKKLENLKLKLNTKVHTNRRSLFELIFARNK